MHRVHAPLTAFCALLVGCGGDRTFDPGAVGDDVRITVLGTVTSGASLAPVDGASVWVDLGTAEGAEARASARTDTVGRFSLQVLESDCSVATERAFRVFARKKGFTDAELTADANGGQPVLRCISREQVVDLQLKVR